MLIYSHSTPEILIASFRTKEQIKNSNYCNLIDDSFPDDVTKLEGDDLIIKEGVNTLNLDFALALSFNAIRDCESACHFGTLLTVNGPNIDTRSLMYYTRRIKTSPFYSCVASYIQKQLDYVSRSNPNLNIPFQHSIGRPGESGVGEGYDGENAEPNKQAIFDDDNGVDTKLAKTLTKLAKDCLTAPCNYLAHTGTFGFLSNVEQVLGATTNPHGSSDITNSQSGVGVDDILSFNKVPELFQKQTLKLSQLATTCLNKFANKFANNTGKGNIAKPDTSTYDAYAKASSQVQSELANTLGDCYRMADYKRRYNPYTYQENGGANAEQAAPPGVAGMPVGYTPVKNNSLTTVSEPAKSSFQTNNTWYCPGGGTSSKERALEGGVQDRRGKPAYTLEQYLAGQAPYVTVAMDSNILPYGTLVTCEKFKDSSGNFIPFRVTDTGGAFKGKGFQKMDIASSSLDRARKGPNFTGTWYIGGSPAATATPSATGAATQPDPNQQQGLSNNQLHDMSPVPTATPAAPNEGDFTSFIASQGLKNYTAADIIPTFTRLNQKFNIRNSEPPRAIWTNIIPTLKVVDKLTDITGIKFEVNSSYRSPAYNAAVGGEKNSWHMKFVAMDISSPKMAPPQVHSTLTQMRNSGVFSGGLGLYGTFVHVDTRGTNVDWRK